MSKGTGLVKKPNIDPALLDAIRNQQAKLAQYTTVNSSNMATINTYTYSNYVVPPPPAMEFKIHAPNGDLILEISNRGNLIFYSEDISEITEAIERQWRKAVMPTIVTQTEIDALAYAAGIYIKDPKDAKALQEKAFDRLMELMLGQQIDYQEGDNPVILRRNL